MTEKLWFKFCKNFKNSKANDDLLYTVYFLCVVQDLNISYVYILIGVHASGV